MNAGALSFLTSLETPTKVSFSAEFSAEGDTGDGAAKGAFDGFANLLDQLVQIAPVEGTVPSVSAEIAETLDMLPATDAESGKDGGSESGNILPVGLPALLPLQLFTPAGDASAGNTGTVAELPVGRLDMARLAKPVAMPLEASVSVHPALVQNPGQTVAPTVARALPDAASIGQIPAGEAQLSRALASLIEAKGAAPATVGATQALAGLAQSVANAPASAAAMPGAALDRAPIAAITIAARPTTTVAVSARIEAGSSEAAAPATVLPANAIKADAKPAAAAQAAAIAPDTASETEAEPDTARPVEAVQASARVSASAEIVRSEPATAAPAAQAAAAPRAEAVTRAADLARPDAFAAIDSIARMVDRLSAARDFGVVPTAALAVMHKEFGELSIAIDRISDTLQVEVAAKDGEAQRALAAALANERAAAMAGDRGVQRSAEAQQNMGQNGGQNAGQNSGQNAGQNGAQTNGQGANGSAADMFGQAASGNAQSNRDGQGRERTRPDGQPLHAQNSAASDRQPAGDDGRYA